MGLILLIVVLLLLFGAVPRAGAYSEGWGGGPSGILGIILIVVLILVLMGHVSVGF